MAQTISDLLIFVALLIAPTMINWASLDTRYAASVAAPPLAGDIPTGGLVGPLDQYRTISGRGVAEILMARTDLPESEGDSGRSATRVAEDQGVYGDSASVSLSKTALLIATGVVGLIGIRRRGGRKK